MSNISGVVELSDGRLLSYGRSGMVWFDQQLSETWAYTIEGVPEEEDFIVSNGFTIAQEVPFVFFDSNESGAWELTDFVFGVNAVCYNGDDILLVYTKQPTNLELATSFFDADIVVGWNVIVPGLSDVPFLTPLEAQSLAIDSDCVLNY